MKRKRFFRINLVNEIIKSLCYQVLERKTIQYLINDLITAKNTYIIVITFNVNISNTQILLELDETVIIQINYNISIMR